jgi:hypothetical protein
MLSKITLANQSEIMLQSWERNLINSDDLIGSVNLIGARFESIKR